MRLVVPEDLRLPRIRQRLRAHRARLRPCGEPVALDHPAAAGPTVLSRRAAVACVLREGERGPEVLLIRRAEHPADPWSGHMAFPGGREEPGDPDLRATAERETAEELGLDLARHGVPLGRLDDLPAVARGRPTGLLIAPFVYELTGPPRLAPNREVQEALWGPLVPMAAGALDTVREYSLGDRVLQLPAYDVQGRVVWGLTYQMLRRLLEVLRGGGAP